MDYDVVESQEDDPTWQHVVRHAPSPDFSQAEAFRSKSAFGEIPPPP
jgi:hypothetical protein